MATKLNVSRRSGVQFLTADATQVVAAYYQTRKSKVYHLEFKVLATYEDFTAGAGYWLQASFITAADGTLTQIGSTRAMHTANESTSSMDVTVAASGTEIRITVTGVADTDINWVIASILEEVDMKTTR